MISLIGSNEALAVTQASSIRSIADLIGKRIAVPFGSTTHFTLLSALKQANIAANRVEIIDMQLLEMLSAWNRSIIDGGCIWQPTLGKMLAANGNLLITAKQVANKGAITADLGFVNQAFAAAYPNFLADYVAVLDEAIERDRNDPQAASVEIAKELGLAPQESLAVMNKLVWLNAAE